MQAKPSQQQYAMGQSRHHALIFVHDDSGMCAVAG